MVIDGSCEKPPCEPRNEDIEFGVFGMLAAQVVGKSEQELSVFCDRLEDFQASRKAVA